jgi:hypothetical protein
MAWEAKMGYSFLNATITYSKMWIIYIKRIMKPRKTTMVEV